MYPEFVAIYIGLGVLALMMIAVIILLIVLLNKSSGTNTYKNEKKMYSLNQQQAANGKVVFCRNCATQFDASQHCCPKCGTQR